MDHIPDELYIGIGIDADGEVGILGGRTADGESRNMIAFEPIPLGFFIAQLPNFQAKLPDDTLHLIRFTRAEVIASLPAERQVHVHRSEPTPCPYCGKPLNADTGDDKAPVAGDRSICLHCGGYLVYTDGPGVRSMTEEEVLDLPAEVLGSLSRIRQRIRRR